MLVRFVRRTSTIMPAVTRIEEEALTESMGKLQCPHLKESGDDNSQERETKTNEKQIKDQASQLDGTGWQ